jgi:hypothetical protein
MGSQLPPTTELNVTEADAKARVTERSPLVDTYIALLMGLRVWSVLVVTVVTSAQGPTDPYPSPMGSAIRILHLALYQRGGNVANQC